MSNIDDTKTAYLAGLLDGEGHIGIMKRRANGQYRTMRYVLRVAIGMYCENTIDWCVQNFDAFKYSRKESYTTNGVKRKVSHDACWQGQKALTVLLQVQPYLITKQKHALIATNFQQYCVIQLKELNKANRKYFTKLSEEELSVRESFYLDLKKLNARQKPLLDLAADCPLQDFPDSSPN